jgi:hypothetical protein
MAPTASRDCAGAVTSLSQVLSSLLIVLFVPLGLISKTDPQPPLVGFHTTPHVLGWGFLFEPDRITIEVFSFPRLKNGPLSFVKGVQLGPS